MSEKEDKSINKKIAELEERVEWFYGEEFSLGQAAENYRRAKDLAEEILGDLEGMKNEITIIAEDFRQK